MRVGERIRKARTSRKMTVSALGEASGLSKGFISQVESGRSNPSIDSLGRIAGALGLGLSDLLHDALMPRQVEAPGLSLPEVFRTGGRGERSTSVRSLIDTALAEYLTAQILPGAAIGGRDVPVESQLRSVAVVVAGSEVRFLQGNMQTTLYAGDVVSWDPARRYTFENHGASTALLFLILEGHTARPEGIGQQVTAIAKSSRSAPQSLSQEGPLRLAAMRAHRDERKGR